MKAKTALFQALSSLLCLVLSPLTHADGDCSFGEHMVCRNVGGGHYGTCDCEASNSFKEMASSPKQNNVAQASSDALNTVNVYCLSDVRAGMQWTVTAMSSSRDLNKITVTLSPEINGQEEQPSLVFTAQKEDLNDGWGGFNVFDKNSDELSVSGAHDGSITAKVQRNGALISIDEELTCFSGNDDSVNFVGTASGTTVPGPYCVGSPAQPANAEADANQQAASFCDKIGRTPVRVGNFTDVNQCVLSNREGLTGRAATDYVYANATYRCENSRARKFKKAGAAGVGPDGPDECD